MKQYGATDASQQGPGFILQESRIVWVAGHYGQDKWVLMYDVFGVNPQNFGFSETTDFMTFTNLGRFNEGVMKATNFKSPKHGTIIHLTKDEARRLDDRWGLKAY